jgi:purine-binding chemotaxis protein CheW
LIEQPRVATRTLTLLVFRLDEQRYALHLGVVDRVVHAVEVTLLPGAPASVLGAIDVAGRVLPVFSLRRRFQRPPRDLVANDQIVIARTGTRTVALVIDEAVGVIECEPGAVVDPERILAGLEQFEGVLQLGEGLVLIHDLDKLLSVDEARALDAALERVG